LEQKENLILDLIASILVRALNIFFHIMPISFNLWLGRQIGTLVYLLSGSRRMITYSNLKAAFHNEKEPKEILKITKNSYRNLAQTFIEILSMTKVNKEYIKKYVSLDHQDRLDTAGNNPKGMLLISAHFGNWELSTATSVALGHVLQLLARDQKMERLNELLNKLRERMGNQVIRKGADIKNIFRVLRKGGNVGILGDQNAGAAGELLPFFGRPASTAVGPYRFAQASGACLLPAFIHRVKGPFHRIVIEEPMFIGKKDDLRPFAEKYNSLLEKQIRLFPDQWLWMHKKWKMTPIKTVMILDDGKKGHLKQSIAVYNQLKRYRIDDGLSEDHTKIEIVSIRFKNKIAKFLFNSLTPLFNSFCQGTLTYLKWALERESFDKASRMFADIIISCGSTLAGVNKMITIENNAKNLTIFDPGALNRNSFNLIIIPRHDLHKAKVMEGKDNCIVTEMAPNLVPILEKEIIYDAKAMMEGRNPRIGVLVGGDNKHFTFGSTLMERLVDALNLLCGRIDGHLYITTSRRTGKKVELILEEAFLNDEKCVKFVSGKIDKDEKTVEKILSDSDIVIVSGESISMVSEAVSSGKPVLVFMPDKRKRGLTKYERFVNGLQDRGFIKVVSVDRIPEEAVLVLSGKVTIKIADDDERIYKEMYKLY